MQSGTTTGSQRWRGDIQGLRALAVVLVVVGHYFPAQLPSGFVGVDIFFVISGYLVAGALLQRALRDRSVGWLDFLSRRARRILPAASVWAAVTVAFFVWFDPLSRVTYRNDSLGALLFFANFRAREESGGYFSVVDPSPFRHYWSLSLEEQFYLLIPIAVALVAALALSARVTVVIIGCLTAASLWGGMQLASWSAPLAFFMLPSRAWEFGVGALAALLAPPTRRWFSATVRFLGAGGIAVTLVAVEPTSLVPGPALVPGVLGTAMLLWAPPTNRSVILGSGPSRWLGDRSYSLYLTHWAPLVYVLIRSNGQPPGLFALACAAAFSLLSAVLLHELIEKPIHRGTRWAPRSRALRVALSVATVAAAVLVAMSASALFVTLTSDRILATPTVAEVTGGPLPRSEVVPANVEPAPDNARHLNVLYDGCHGQLGTTVPTPCFFGSPSATTDIVVLGDSHAATAYDGLREAFPDRRFAFVTRTSCPLFPPEQVATECDSWRAAALEKVREINPRLVILTNFTSAYRDGQSDADFRQRIREGWLATLASLKDLPVVVLGDVPAAPQDPPRCLSRHADSVADCDFTPDLLQRSAVETERAAVASQGVRWIDTWSWYCDQSCATVSGNIALWRDAAGHLTPEGSRLMAARFREVLRPELATR